jgi:hypothetical protein
MDIASTIGPRKIVITVMTLCFPEESSFTLDLSPCLTLVERRVDSRFESDREHLQESSKS